MGDRSAMHCDAHGLYRCGICETLEDRNIRLERRIAELEAENSTLRELRERDRVEFITRAESVAKREMEDLQRIAELASENARLRDGIADSMLCDSIVQMHECLVVLLGGGE